MATITFAADAFADGAPTARAALKRRAAEDAARLDDEQLDALMVEIRTTLLSGAELKPELRARARAALAQLRAQADKASTSRPPDDAVAFQESQVDASELARRAVVFQERAIAIGRAAEGMALMVSTPIAVRAATVEARRRGR